MVYIPNRSLNLNYTHSKCWFQQRAQEKDSFREEREFKCLQDTVDRAKLNFGLRIREDSQLRTWQTSCLCSTAGIKCVIVMKSADECGKKELDSEWNSKSGRLRLNILKSEIKVEIIP